jgi:hypothetical protein
LKPCAEARGKNASLLSPEDRKSRTRAQCIEFFNEIRHKRSSRSLRLLKLCRSYLYPRLTNKKMPELSMLTIIGPIPILLTALSA